MSKMADKSKKTPSKKSKGEEAAPTFYSDLQKHCVENDFTAEIVCYVLNAEVTPGFPWTTYKLENKPNPDTVERINIYIANDNFEKQGLICKLYIKRETIPINFLEALFLVLPKYETLTTIKFDYCKLTSSQIEFLQTILNEHENIVELSLNGNPNGRQNFDAVLESTYIKHLSLKRCNITARGMKKICKALWNNKLLTLNLTGNFIDDIAVKHLAKMLRQNRKLRTINLADNWITDVGCYEIMSSLQNFILTHDETVIKRQKNFDYYKQKAELTQKYKIEQMEIQASAKVTSTKRNSRKDSKSKNKTTDEDKQLNMYVEANATPRTHPFALDIVEKAGELHCSGNLRLSYINLAYNKISCTGYRNIIETLNYQLENDNLGSGLVYITLDGNTDLITPEFTDIYRILLEKKLKAALNSGSRTIIRRPSSKYSSRINFA